MFVTLVEQVRIGVGLVMCDHVVSVRFEGAEGEGVVNSDGLWARRRLGAVHVGGAFFDAVENVDGE